MKTIIEQVSLHSGVPGDAEFQQLDVKSGECVMIEKTEKMLFF